jgi:hypothetical protein
MLGLRRSGCAAETSPDCARARLILGFVRFGIGLADLLVRGGHNGCH